MLFQMAPVCCHLELPGDTLSLSQWTNLIGMGFTVPHGTVPLVVIVIAAIVVKLGSKFAHFSRYLNETWVGTMVICLIAHIMMYDRICHAVIEL